MRPAPVVAAPAVDVASVAPVPVAILIGIFVLIVAGMWWGWRRHATRDAMRLQEPAAIAAESRREVLGPISATYVSTTWAGRALERVHAYTLGSRSRAVICVNERAITIERTGARSFEVERHLIDAVSETPGQAGKFTGGNGILRLTWRLGDASVDTAFLIDEREQHAALLHTLSHVHQERA